MDFSPSARVREYSERIEAFMDAHVYPNEAMLEEQLAADRWVQPPIIEDLKVEARSQGLWNLFLPDDEHGAGLTNLEYAPLAEIMGRSLHLAPEAMNCSAPDTGNMEVFHDFGTDAQKDEWLVPLLAGEIRSCFGMTEPDVASSDATNIRTEIRQEGDELVINGRKWWTSGAMHPHCRVMILMGKTDPDAPRHLQQSQAAVAPRGAKPVQGRRRCPERPVESLRAQPALADPVGQARFAQLFVEHSCDPLGRMRHSAPPRGPLILERGRGSTPDGLDRES